MTMSRISVEDIATEQPRRKWGQDATPLDPAALALRAVARWRKSFPLRHVLFAETLGKPDTPLPTDFAAAVEACLPPLNAGGVAILCGPRGRGKTQVATYLALCGASKGKEAQYWPLADLFGEFRYRCYGGEHESERAVLREWAEMPLLVIDELHCARPTDFGADLLERLVDKRYNAMMPTVLISNLMPDALREHLGKSAASRLDESGVYVEMTGRNYRAEGGVK